MSICPECRKDIEYLILAEDIIFQSKVTIGKDGDLQYIRQDEDIIDCLGYACPKCDIVLFRNEDKAESFLRGE